MVRMIVEFVLAAAFAVMAVVTYQDGSTAATTGGGGATDGRWGDYLRTHRSQVTGTHFDGFGYFTTNPGGAITQNPYHVRYGR